MEPRSPEQELKALLLSSELETLERLELLLEELRGRVGDDEALQESLGRVIVDVLRDAGTEDHERLSRILAPLMLSSLQTEIRNSRDMMVEALYPLTGRLVTTAVRNAFRDMLRNLDSKVSDTFSATALRLRAEAFVTRRSYAELLLERGGLFQVDESLVIHRPTGLLIARVGPIDEGDEEVDRELVGSMLNAVMALTRDAFGDDGSSDLETLEFGGSRLFIKSSPTLVLVVATRGAPPASFATRLDDLFLTFLETWGPTLSDFDGDLEVEDEMNLVADVRSRIDVLSHGAPGENGGTSVRRPAIVLTIVLLALVGWLGYRTYQGMRIRGVEHAARDVIARQSELVGFPIDVAYDAENEVLTVRGLLPSEDAGDRLRSALAESMAAPVEFALASLPAPSPPVDPLEELERFTELNAIYFVSDTTPRAPENADALLEELAERIRAAPDHVRIRVIGYADPLGSAEANEAVTLARARFAYDRLLALGVPEQRLVTLGRPGERLLSQRVGEGSDSRRTEFEVYFTEQRVP